MKKLRVAASMQLSDVGEMTPRQRKDIADWLRSQARRVLVDGDKLARRYRARFYWWSK